MTEVASEAIWPRVVSLIASAPDVPHALGLGDTEIGRLYQCNRLPSVLALPQLTRPKFEAEGSSLEIDRSRTRGVRCGNPVSRRRRLRPYGQERGKASGETHLNLQK
jgi:hypothetical protein